MRTRWIRRRRRELTKISPASIVFPRPTSSAISKLTRGIRRAFRRGTSWKSSIWTAPWNGLEMGKRSSGPSPSGSRKGAAAVQREARNTASKSSGGIGSVASTTGRAVGSRSCFRASISHRSCSSMGSWSSLYSRWTRWRRPLSPSNGSTAETTARRFRTVANIPTRGPIDDLRSYSSYTHRIPPSPVIWSPHRTLRSPSSGCSIRRRGAVSPEPRSRNRSVRRDLAGVSVLKSSTSRRPLVMLTRSM